MVENFGFGKRQDAEIRSRDHENEQRPVDRGLVEEELVVVRKTEGDEDRAGDRR